MGEEAHEKIVLTLDSSGVKGNSLSGLIRQLEDVERHIGRVNAAMGGMKLNPRTAKEAASEISKALNVKGTVDMSAVTKALKYSKDEIREFERFVNKTRGKFGAFDSGRKFPSPTNAAAAVAAWENTVRASLKDLLNPKVSSVTGKGGAITLQGDVVMKVPAAAVHASVEGQILLQIPAGQIVASGTTASGGRNPETGTFQSSGEGRGSRAKKSAKGPLEVGGRAGEVSRVRTETEKNLREAVTELTATGELITTTHDSIEGVIKTVTRSKTGNTALEQYRTARRILEENFRQAKAALDPKDGGFGLAALQEKQAAQLLALLSKSGKVYSASFMQSLPPAQQATIASLLTESAGTLSAKGGATRASAVNDLRAQILKGYFTQNYGPKSLEFGGGGMPMKGDARKAYEAWWQSVFAGRLGNTTPPPFNAGSARTVFSSPSQLPVLYGRGGLSGRGGGRRGRPGEPIDVEFSQDYIDAEEVKPGKRPPSGGDKLKKAFSESFGPMGFATHLVKVAGWAAAVGVLYKSLELATYSMHRFIEVGAQTAHLQVVFHGVGGSAKELTDDILKLAAANGQDTHAAMESAIEWSRLGLTRKQVNEAVKVSLMAANVAQISAEEATKQLSSIMHVYNLEVRDLDGVLGMLVNTSMKYNVTTEDLLKGLDQTAGVARQAGFGLAELQAIIAAVVGKTGQAGTTVGTMVKYIINQFNNPQMQKTLRSFGVETLTNSGAQKSGSQILKELFVRWQSLNGSERQNLTLKMAGRFHGARFVAMMDNYVESQKLAIDSQLHLNAAQTANVQILQAMKAQVAGLRAEWDRFSVNKLVPDFTGLVRFGKNVLHAVNETGGKPGKPLPKDLSKFTDDQLEDLRKTPAGEFSEEIEEEKARRWVAKRKAAGKSTHLGSYLLNFFGKDKFGLEAYTNVINESDFQRGQKGFSNKIQQHGAASEAALMQARLFDTVGQILTTPKSKSQTAGIEAVAGYMDEKTRGAFMGAISGGDMAAAQKILGQARKAAQEQSLVEVDAMRKETAVELAQAKAELGAATASGDQGRVAQAQTAIEELTKATDDYTQALVTMEGQTDEVMQLNQRYVNLLREQSDVMDSFGRLSSQVSTGTATGKLDEQVAELTAQKEMLERSAEELRDAGADLQGKLQSDLAYSEILQERLPAVEAQLASAQSPRMRELASMYDERAIAQRRASVMDEGLGVGNTEAEKLLRRESGLQRGINEANYKGFGEGDTNALVRVEQMTVDLMKTKAAIQERILTLRSQEKQIMIDANREFQKSLLFAGPGELLKRLYVGQLPDKMSAGQFMALDPEARRMYYERRGGDAGAINRVEQKLLNGRGQTVEEEARTQRGLQLEAGAYGTELGRATSAKVATQPANPGLDALMTQAKKASTQVGALGTAAANAAATLNQLPGIVQNMVTTFLNEKKSGGAMARTGISAGFSLGEGVA